MLYADLVAAALGEKRAGFTAQEDAFGAALMAYRTALADLGRRYPSRAALETLLDAMTGRGSIGARPLAAYGTWVAQSGWMGSPPVVAFGQAFAQHEAARTWAEAIVRGTTTVAVDGSQIMPWRDVSIPVALVQAAIFANPHDPGLPYVKDARVEILGPDDLVAPSLADETELNAQLAADELVNLRRFQLEARTLAEWMRGWHPAPGTPPPLALLDGSLIVSFALRKESPLRSRYIAAVAHLLETSEQTRVPLIAYIDTSFARDLATLLRVAFPELALPNERRITDSLLWGDALAWGDASVPFLSARGDVLAEYGKQAGSIAFAYLRAAADRPPARLEMPRWLAESDLWPRMLDVVRAELIAGNGYPYAIETADAVAVISTEDRARFYRIFQQFAEDAGLPLSFSRKLLSKSRRR
jgi:hypothetical protein